VTADAGGTGASGSEPGRQAGALLVELRLRDEPRIDPLKIADVVRRRSHLVVEHLARGSAIAFVFAETTDGARPSISLLSGAGRAALDTKLALEQTWDWPGAADVVAGARNGVLVADGATSTIERAERLRLFNVLLGAAVEVLHPDALHWITAQRVVEPAAFLRALAADPLAFGTAVNVRYFRTEGDEATTIMDTMGLVPFGLPDVQLRSATLDASRIAAKVFGIARYLFDAGDVIADGHTVPGVAEDERWPCVHRVSLVPPERVVLDVEAHAA
jgi:hypothetical protein